MLIQNKGGDLHKNNRKPTQGKKAKEKLGLGLELTREILGSGSDKTATTVKIAPFNVDKSYPMMKEISLERNEENILTHIVATSERTSDIKDFENQIESYILQEKLSSAEISISVFNAFIVVIDTKKKKRVKLIQIDDIVDTQNYWKSNLQFYSNNEHKYKINCVRFVQRCNVTSILGRLYNYQDDKQKFVVFVNGCIKTALIPVSTRTVLQHDIQTYVLATDLKEANWCEIEDDFKLLDVDTKNTIEVEISKNQCKSYYVIAWLSLFFAHNRDFFSELNKIEHETWYSLEGFQLCILVIQKTHDKISFTPLLSYLLIYTKFKGLDDDDENRKKFLKILEEKSKLLATMLIYMFCYIYFDVYDNKDKKDIFFKKLEEIYRKCSTIENYIQQHIEDINITFKSLGNEINSHAKEKKNSRQSLALPSGAVGINASSRSRSRRKIDIARMNEAIKTHKSRLLSGSKLSGLNGGSPKTRKKKFRKNKLETHL